MKEMRSNDSVKENKIIVNKNQAKASIDVVD